MSKCARVWWTTPYIASDGYVYLKATKRHLLYYDESLGVYRTACGKTLESDECFQSMREAFTVTCLVCRTTTQFIPGDIVSLESL